MPKAAPSLISSANSREPYASSAFSRCGRFIKFRLFLITLLMPVLLTGMLSAEYTYNGCLDSPEADFTGPEGVQDCIVDLLDLRELVINWLSDMPIPVSGGGWYKFDEGSGSLTYDSSDNDNTGTLYNMDAADWVAGHEGTALDFDGSDDYVQIADSNSLSVGNGDFTISAWIYPHTTSSIHTVIAKVHSNREKEYALSINQGTIWFDIESQANNGNAHTDYDVVTPGNWQHIMAAYKKSTQEVTIYYNYVPQSLSTNTITEPSTVTSDDLFIGMMGGTYYNRNFDGLIDDVRIYNYAVWPDDKSPYDLNNDDNVDVRDYALLSDNWLYDNGIHNIFDWIRTRPFTIMGLSLFVDNLDTVEYAGAGLGPVLPWYELGQSFTGGMGQCEKACLGGLKWIARMVADNGADAAFQNTANLAASYCGGEAWMAHDEPYGNQMEAIAEAVAWLRENFPWMPVYVNCRFSQNPYTLWGGTGYPSGYDFDDYLDQLIDIVDTDILMYDAYPFEAYTTRTTFWKPLAQVRAKGLATNRPYWAFIQSAGWNDDEGDLDKRIPSESDLRMHIFVHLTAGYTGLAYFTYDYFGIGALLDAADNPTDLYYDAAEVNAEVMNLGHCLRFLTSTDLRYIPGIFVYDDQQYPNPVPETVPIWSSGAGGDSKIIDVDIDHTQPDTWGREKDGLLGFFTDDAGEKYFILTNLDHGMDEDPELRTLPFYIQFDNSVNELLMLNRQTGAAEIVPLTNHRLDVTLLGGSGRLYKYNTGRGFAPDVPLP